MHARVLCSLALLAVLVVAGSRASTARPSGHFFHISDFHVDPFYEASETAATRCRDREQVLEAFLDHLRNETGADGLPAAQQPLSGASVARAFGVLSAATTVGGGATVEVRPREGLDDAAAPHPIGRFGCDSPALLAQAAVKGMLAVDPSPDFIVMTGDSAAHDLWSPYLRLLGITQCASIIQSAFPSTPLIVSIGNNDLVPDYYLRLPQHEASTYWLRQLYDAWKQWIPQDQKNIFLSGGYYSLALDNVPVTVISLNSVIYNSGHTPLYEPTSDPDPGGQFQWITAQLETARAQNRRVYITGHVPPRYGDWQDGYLETYSGIVTQYADVIAAHLFGHHHTDQFSLINNGTGAGNLSMFLSPALSPMSGNNPTFRRMLYDTASGDMLDYHQYYSDLVADTRLSDQPGQSDLVKWKLEYTFSSAFQVNSTSPANVGRVVQRLVSDEAMYARYNAHIYALADSGRVGTLCQMTHGQNRTASELCQLAFGEFA
eukprot:TRINITY_DN852_c1_g1_i1.p1 TRINITY_DN852_c1_g1~~TRINITY_DN852_c1_g1_i1.p1  ORF type:complete len:514 (+),score=100.11 TRINITY_DN852_c1_g1_i1:75-1544(+)